MTAAKQFIRFLAFWASLYRALIKPNCFNYASVVKPAAIVLAFNLLPINAVISANAMRDVLIVNAFN
jgi:hypothetical protein